MKSCTTAVTGRSSGVIANDVRVVRRPWSGGLAVGQGGRPFDLDRIAVVVIIQTAKPRKEVPEGHGAESLR
jgi:hypothetical protein